MPKYCANCTCELGFFSSKDRIADGYVCKSCLESAGLWRLPHPEKFSTTQVKELIATYKPLKDKFSPTKVIEGYLAIDENNKLFMASGKLFHCENLISFELLENGSTVTKGGGVGRAVVGGLLFGGVGAVVGGVTGGKKSNNVCTSMRICLILRNEYCDTSDISLIKGMEISTDSVSYQNYSTIAQKCLSALKIMTDEVQNATANTVPQGLSVADEILKFKNLLDQNIITEEEFSARKKELLAGERSQQRLEK